MGNKNCAYQVVIRVAIRTVGLPLLMHLSILYSPNADIQEVTCSNYMDDIVLDGLGTYDSDESILFVCMLN